MHSDQVIFTSGGTEANNLAILGLADDKDCRVGIAHQMTVRESVLVGGAHPTRPPGHIIISSIEHPSISRLTDAMSRRGWHVDRLGVNARGVIRVDELAVLIRPETRIVAAMLGQNETGVLQPVAEIAAICAQRGTPLHTDAAQVVGKLPVDFRAHGAATMTVAAHKFHGPLGVGVLVVRHGTQLQPQLHGGFQQGGMRPGTESVALAVGMCRALELWHGERDECATRMRELRDRFERIILEKWPGAQVIGATTARLPHTSHIAFVGLDRQSLFMALDQAGVACSTGSACASGSSEPSPVLIAMGCETSVIESALRFSLGATTTVDDIDEAAQRILRCCNDLRRQVPA